jgi:hypothetical protein
VLPIVRLHRLCEGRATASRNFVRGKKWWPRPLQAPEGEGTTEQLACLALECRVVFQLQRIALQLTSQNRGAESPTPLFVTTQPDRTEHQAQEHSASNVCPGNTDGPYRDDSTRGITSWARMLDQQPSSRSFLPDVRRFGRVLLCAPWLRHGSNAAQARQHQRPRSTTRAL